MKLAIRFIRGKNFVRSLAVALALAASSANAQRAMLPGRHSHFSATPIPFEQAHLAALRADRARPQPAAGSTSSTPLEIVQLARALKNDPDLIYQYVHDNIAFSPLFGLLKGPVGTYLDQRGDAFDQASLMVALLNQASLANFSISNVGYIFGQLSLTSAQLQSWLGVDSNPESVGGVLASGGIPATLFSDGSAEVGHVWVQVSINGTTYVFDPAFKPQTWKSGIVSSLPGIMGYTQAQFLADGGGTATAISITGVNRTNLRNDLATYANNLASYIRTKLPTAGVSDLLGGPAVVPVPLVNGVTVRQTSNPNQTGGITNWATIPSEYYATLSITLPGAAAQTFNSFAIYGHRLSLFFDSNYVPTLYRDGVAQVSGSAQPAGSSVAIAESVNIPWEQAADQNLTQYVTAATNENGGSAGYVIATGWDQVGRGMIEKHRGILTQAIQSGAAANSELVLGETVAIIGYTWLAECAAQQQISDQLLGTVTEYLYGGGIAGEATGPGIASPYVDLPLNFVNTPTRVNGATTQSPNSMAAFLDSSGTSSSFESTTLEQTQANTAGFTAASTIKLLDMALQNGDTIYDINNGTASDTQAVVQSTLQTLSHTYTNQSNLNQITSYVNSGYRVIAPLHDNIQIGSWTGVGFKTMVGSSESGYSYGEIISGGLEGGFGGTNDPPANSSANTDGSMQPGSDSPGGSSGPGNSLSGNSPVNVGDPIDHRKGSLQYSSVDLTVGAKPFPYGMALERLYDSGAQNIAGPLGNGWTHKFNVTAQVGSDGFTGMGQGSLLNAASAIVALYVSSDLVNGQSLTGQSNLSNFVFETVVNHWFTDQLTQNVVNFTEGWNTLEYVKMADGSYSPPVGNVAILDAPNGTFRYRDRAGVTMNFNSSGQISTWRNAAGNTIDFTYSNGLLSTVANPGTSRQLTFTYTGNQISSVSDGNRTVSYTYTNGNLTAFTDPLGQQTTFGYDTSGTEDTEGHLTQIYYPSHPGNSFLTTYYDSLERVAQQSDANGNMSQTFFAGARTEVDDAVGNQHVWYNDPHGNILTEIQDYGAVPHLNITSTNTYDGQSDLLSATKPEGNSVAYTYDALLNPLTVTANPKPGFNQAPLAKTLTYVAPVATLPEFEEVQTATDYQGNLYTFSHNSSTGTLSSQAAPAVPKPGAAVSSPTTTYTYTTIGLPITVTDAEGRVTHFAYDPTFGDQVTTMTVDYGRLNLTSSLTYNTAGDVATSTDADGHVTTNTYDNLRRLVETDGALAGVVTKYTYYPDGQMHALARQLTAGTFETTQYSYTLEDQLSTVTDPLGNTVTTTYDADDRKQTVTTQVSATQNRQRTYTYDALSRLYQVSDTTAGSPGTPLETHSYSPNSNPLSFTDANGHAMSYAYDGFDRLIQTTYPDGGSEKYTYDPNGDVLQKTARSGQTITYTYDALRRMASKNGANETGGQVTYGYDYTGLILQAVDGTSANPYQIGYDTAGRASGFTDQQGRNTQVRYDGVGNRTRLQWPAGTNGAGSYFVTYSYDALNRVTEIDSNGSASAPLAKYQWDALSRPTLITHGDGTTDSYSQYDAADNLLTLAETFTGGSSVSFQYGWFKNHQRQSVSVSNNAFQYSPSVGTVSYSPADVDNGYAAVGGVNLTYDGNHNLTYDGFNTLGYDVENRLIQAQNSRSGSSQYFYDPMGHRNQKSVNGVTTQFVLVGSEEIADYSGAGTPQVLTVRGVGGSPVASIAVSSGAVAYYHHDALGSTVALTQSGTSGPAETFTYSEFGVPAAGSGSPYLFAGYRYDAETGLYYVRARYYSPQLGRFLQTDPIGTMGGRNLYAYVNNDPINWIDPYGTAPDAPQAPEREWASPAQHVKRFGGHWIDSGGAWVRGEISEGHFVWASGEGNILYHYGVLEPNCGREFEWAEWAVSVDYAAREFAGEVRAFPGWTWDTFNYYQEHPIDYAQYVAKLF